MTDNQIEKIKRVTEVRKLLGLRQTEMSKILGINRVNLSAIENFRENRQLPNGTSYILEKELNVNPIWLDTGEGDIFLTKQTTYPRLEAKPISLASDPADYNNDGSRFEELPDGTIRMRVPVIPHKAFAGYLRGFQDPEFYEDLPYISVDVTKQHRGHYLAFEVKGDSMTTLEPEKFRQSIFDGVTVVGRELAKHHWRYKLHTNNYDNWVIVHKTEGILLKQILEHDIEQCTITIHSLNPDKKAYPDQTLQLDDVEQIFNVVQKIDK
jgi:transcriptional regulator with XRE-family HTH domain